ncbi:MAG: PfkB family carbohydrate kinase [Chloroflexia bacterium]
MASPSELLIIGHIARDLLEDGGYRAGGTALYAAVTATRLGWRATVWTSAATPPPAFPGVRVICLPSAHDTTFWNRYRGGHREQTLLSRASPLTPDSFPPSPASVVLLGPIAQEVPPSWVEHFPRAIVGACLQGWLRAWDATGHVRWTPWRDAARWLPCFDAAFLSLEDLGGQRARVRALASCAHLLVLTEGAQGATLFQEGRPLPVPAFPVAEVDPTGAGDVFAAAFLIRYAEGATPFQAARFAAATAALSVQGPGVEAVPDRSAVEALLAEVG